VLEVNYFGSNVKLHAHAALEAQTRMGIRKLGKDALLYSALLY
jgi:hypothetical protein